MIPPYYFLKLAEPVDVLASVLDRFDHPGKAHTSDISSGSELFYVFGVAHR